MKVSIIMASFLGNYPLSANDKERKFCRAVDSCLNQSYIDTELVIVSDGCDTTEQIVMDKYFHDVTFNRIPKQKIWSGVPRQTGINIASGEMIVYCDTDDYIGKDHVSRIIETVGSYDWAYFDDLIYNKDLEGFLSRRCLIDKKFNCGTSNIIHKKTIGAWMDNTYLHDWHFINSLKKASINFGAIGQGQYFVCHIPKIYDI